MILWIKTAHIFFVISWMAGVFYLPRIFVHCAEAKKNRESMKRLLIMARKLIRFMIPLYALMLLSGLTLWWGYGIGGSWLHLKLSGVLLLSAHYFYSFRLLADIQKKHLRSSFFYRCYNEIPVPILFAIIYFVVFKPF